MSSKTKHELLGELNVVYCYAQILSYSKDIPVSASKMVSIIIDECKKMEKIITQSKWDVKDQNNQQCDSIYPDIQ